MIALLTLLALAEEPAVSEGCGADAAVHLQAVAERGVEKAYLCLIDTDAFLPAVVQAAARNQDDATAGPRFTRALALHLARVSDKPLDPAHVRLLNPADRRLLADGVRARSGRRSPSDEHHAVFEKQGWYKPLPTGKWTENTLTEVEKANIELANKPPPEPPPAKPDPGAGDPDAGRRQQPEGGPEPAGGCGCAAAPLPGWLVFAVLPLLALRHRR